MDLTSFAALALVSFLGATVQATTGFGFAILAVPFFLLIMGSLAAIQVTAVTNMALSVMLVPWLFRDAPIRLMLWLFLGNALGFPVGLALFRAADLTTMKLAVGGFITLFALFLSWREWSGGHNGNEAGEIVPRPAAEVGVGFVSGVMGSALAMPGPAVMLYLAAIRPGRRVSRAATLTLFGFSYGAISILHTLWGGMTGATWVLALQLIPFVMAGAVAGHYATGYLSEHRFRLLVLAILIASGLYAVWTAV